MSYSRNKRRRLIQAGLWHYGPERPSREARAATYAGFWAGVAAREAAE